ncbi:hypothetical protein CC79DRAFT_1337372 [Sarocladium strictum]
MTPVFPASAGRSVRANPTRAFAYQSLTMFAFGVGYHGIIHLKARCCLPTGAKSFLERLCP